MGSGRGGKKDNNVMRQGEMENRKEHLQKCRETVTEKIRRVEERDQLSKAQLETHNEPNKHSHFSFNPSAAKVLVSIKSRHRLSIFVTNLAAFEAFHKLSYQKSLQAFS